MGAAIVVGRFARNKTILEQTGRCALSPKSDVTPTSAGSAEVDRFVREVGQLAPRPAGTRGRLLFALDATASREPTWDLATSLQGEMFVAAAESGGRGTRPPFFRGF